MGPRTGGGTPKRYCSKRCRNAAWYRKNPELVQGRFKAWNQRNKEYINSLKMGKPCTDCGQTFDDLTKLDFDHVPERGEKLFNIAAGHRYSPAILGAEIFKCELVCKGCHIKRTITRGRMKVSLHKLRAAASLALHFEVGPEVVLDKGDTLYYRLNEDDQVDPESFNIVPAGAKRFFGGSRNEEAS